mmetsp:Transcript_45554/g.113137  ORF Transcript_45554/g.113137 Transcript_45554/m.113137 type:complete len:274 (-) Transcript_45554:221-1042(-)
MSLEGEFLLLNEVPHFVVVLSLLLLEILRHARNETLVLLPYLSLFFLPGLCLPLPLCGQLLVARHLDHHLGLEAGLQLLGRLGVGLLDALEVLLILSLHVVLLLAQQLVSSPFLLEFVFVFVFEFSHFLLVEGVPVSELEVHLVGQLLHLPLQLHQSRLLLVQEEACHEDLVRIRQSALLVTLGHHSVLLADVEHVQRPILRAREQVHVVEGDAQPGTGARVALVLDVLTMQWETIRTDGPRVFVLGHGSEECLGRVGQHYLTQLVASLQVMT